MSTDSSEKPQDSGTEAGAANEPDTSPAADPGAAGPPRGPLAMRQAMAGATERRHFTSRPPTPTPPPARPNRPPVPPPAPVRPAAAPLPPAPVASLPAVEAEPAASTDAPASPESPMVVTDGVAPLSPAARGTGALAPGGAGAGAPGGGGAAGGQGGRGPGGRTGGKKGPPAVAEPLPKAVIPKPSRRDRLSDELEAELAAALGGKSLDTILTPNPAERELMELDSRRAATIVRVHGDNVFFSLGGRNEGVASSRQFRDPPEPGQSYDVIIKSFNAEEGLYELLIPGASIEVADWGDLQEGAIVEAKITGANTGGLECDVNKLRGFIPISQIAIYRVENTAEFVGQKMLCVVTEANPQRRNLVLSRRAMLEREKEDAKRAFYQELQVGQLREGTVRKIEDFGAFVDLNGADGLIHISQLSWERVKHPSEVLKEGQKVQVRVERFDPQTGKIGLSLRSLQEHPWTNIGTRFPVGATVRGTVTRLANFGAFVKLAAGVEGLIHISELAHQRVNQVGSVVKEGQDVEVKVLSVDVENQRIGLSLKATIAAPQSAKPAAEEEPDAPPRELAVKKRPGPLKGGFDRPTGGEGIGLNW